MVIEQYFLKRGQSQINFVNVIYLLKVHERVIKFPWALLLFTFNVVWSNIQNGGCFRCECWLVSWCQFIKIKQFTFWSPKQYTLLLSCEKKTCEVMTTISKVSFVIYTSSQNLSGYFGLTTIMTCKIFTDMSNNGIPTGVLRLYRNDQMKNVLYLLTKVVGL